MAARARQENVSQSTPLLAEKIDRRMAICNRLPPVGGEIGAPRTHAK